MKIWRQYLEETNYGKSADEESLQERLADQDVNQCGGRGLHLI
jgi:hypothetical protein